VPGEVLIVGAGPAGAASALLLARAGLRVTLVEREADFERVFRGEGLMPSGVDALLEMGLGGLLAAIPCRRLESWDVYVGGQPVFSVPEPVAELGERAVRVIPQPAFLEALVAEAGRFRGFRFESGVGVRGLLREQGRVVGVRLQGGGGGEEERRADLVLGCDGRASTVRARAGLELRLLPEHYDVAWFKLPAPPRLQERCCMMLMTASPARAAACYTSWDGCLRFALLIPKGRLRALRPVEWVDEMARTAPPWLAEHLRSSRAGLEGPQLLDVVVGRCPRWSAPGCLLLGDAAHPMSPIRAQGINLALRDAIVAANHLVPALRRGAAPEALDAAAVAVQVEREPEVVRAQTLQLRDARGLGSRAAPLLLFLARHLGRAFGRYDWARRAWLRAQHDLRFGSTEVRLRV
jgi:2-polyprenyl-6-methoxyphenol hydroxylase-like FAD-dependent oxidoreductase